MNLKIYLSDFVARSEINKREKKLIDRDILIIFDFFGLTDNKIPNFQTVGDRFSLSREYIRQRIKLKIKDEIKDTDRELLKGHLKVLQNKKIITFNDLKAKLEKKSFFPNEMNVLGFFNLLAIFEIEYPFEIYNFEFKKATKKDFDLLNDFLIVNKNNIKSIKVILQKIFKQPGINGLINLNEFRDSIDDISFEYLEYIVTNSKGSWTFKDGSKFWYMFENRSNSIIHNMGKLKSIISNCDKEILSNTLFDAISIRPSNFNYPSPKLISLYLEESIFTNIMNNKVFFKDSLESPNLSQSDELVINFFKKNKIQETDYPELKKVFLENGFSTANADKNCYHSTFIHVDKSGGRTNYKLSYILKYNSDMNLIDDRYSIYRDKLIQFLDNTDKNSKSSMRAEQSILRDYLFKDKKYLKCGICQKEFSVNSLVTAHKKKRSECSDNERVDPRIVWPLCKFGCDHLFEERYIIIENGETRIKDCDELTRDEKVILSELNKIKISDEWYIKSEKYFKDIKTT